MSSDSRTGAQSEGADTDEIIIGKVVSVNVPRRELRIAPETSHPERFNELHELRLRTKKGQTICLVPSSIRITGSVVIARVDTDDEDQIASARKAHLVVSRQERFRLPEHEYYVDDLIGLIVKDTEGSIIGRLSEVLQTPANDIYQVLDDDGRELLIPAIEDVIVAVDITHGEITVDVSNLT